VFGVLGLPLLSVLIVFASPIIRSVRAYRAAKTELKHSENRLQLYETKEQDLREKRKRAVLDEEKKLAENEKRFDEEIQQAKDAYSKSSQIIYDEFSAETGEAKQQYLQTSERLSGQRQETVANIRQRQEIWQPLWDVCRDIRKEQHWKKEHLNISGTIPSWLSFTINVLSLPDVPEEIASLLEPEEPFIPFLFPFPFAKPLFTTRLLPNSPNTEQYCQQVEDNMIPELLLRLLFSMPVGTLQITVADPKKMGTSLSMFSPLLDIKKLVPAGKFLTRSHEIEESLREHCNHVAECIQKHFRGSIADWTQYNKANKENPLPYKVLCLFDFPEQFSDQSVLYLKRLLELGPRCGILPVILGSAEIDSNKHRAASEIPLMLWNVGDVIGRHFSLQTQEDYTPPLKRLSLQGMHSPFAQPKELAQDIPQYMEWIREGYLVHADKKHTVDTLWDSQNVWTETSGEGIIVPVGKSENGKPVLLELGKDQHHVLLAGRSGSGKSNLLHVLLHGLLHRYSADELNLYLLDYKDGVEFNKYTTPPLPQIKFIATVNDIEYGRTVLEHFCSELERRNELFKKTGVSDIQQYRTKTGGKLPRAILMMDEFQVLFGGDYAMTNSIHANFDTLLRKGRSAGIHMILATQTLSGLSNVANFDTLLRNIGIRIALNCDEADSYRILANNNRAAADLSMKTEGIINYSSGQPSGNIRFAIPHADFNVPEHAPNSLPQHLAHIAGLAEQRGFSEEMKVFDGTKLPLLPPEKFFAAVAKVPQIMLGNELTFAENPFMFEWKPAAGKNLCIAGNDDNGVFREGILRSLLTCVTQHQMFGSIVYYHSDAYSTPPDISDFGGVVRRDHTWDGDLSELTGDFTAKRSLLIIDTLDDAEMFYPPKPVYGIKKEETSTPADSLLTLLEKGPRHGTFAVIFVNDWNQFVKNCGAYQEFFGLRIGFRLNEPDAGKLVYGNTGTGFRGLSDGSKAVFVDQKRNVQTLFRPFVVKEKEQ
jgi:energy-coupling factor transporter ATP-binding protein EcfA2